METPLPVTVDSHLRVRSELIDQTTVEVLRSALCFTDPEDDDYTIDLLRECQGKFILPRGFAHRLRVGMQQMGYRVAFEDERVTVGADLATKVQLDPAYSLRPYQAKAVKRMLTVGQGIYEAPTGSGKSTTCAHFIAQANQRTLVLTDKINLATQWQERIRQAIGVTPTIIGAGSWQESEVTIALRQSLWAKRKALDESGWWATWGAVIADEIHNISAQTVRELLQRFPARYRIGVSATPDRHGWLSHVSRSIVGEIFCRTSRDELAQAGVLVTPSVVAVKTPLTFPWTGGRANHRGQWQRLLVALREDRGRGLAIMEVMRLCHGHATLLHTEQLRHANNMQSYAYAAGWAVKDVFLLTGKQKDQERQKIIERADKGNVLVISTIGKEALDIPRLDRFLLVWPTKNQTATTQLIGRIERTHDLNDDQPVVYDFWDHLVPPLNNHFHARRQVYAKRGLSLSVI